MKHVSTALLLLALVGCTREQQAPVASADPEEAPTGNRIAITASVRSNLGLTFAKVEKRSVAGTLRLPGRLALVPGARVEHAAHLAGRVEVLVEQFARVEAGDELVRITSPDWAERQQLLAAARGRILFEEEQLRGSSKQIEAMHTVVSANEAGVRAWKQRLADLESVLGSGGGGADLVSEARTALAAADSEYASAQRELAELESRMSTGRATIEAARLEFDAELSGAAAATGIAAAELGQLDADGRPLWLSLEHVSVRAATRGVVSELFAASGSWIAVGNALVTVIDPSRMRFETRASQSDLGSLTDGAPCAIVPTRTTLDARSIPFDDVMNGVLVIGPQARSSDNTLELFGLPTTLSSWARPGIAAQLEIYTSGAPREVIALPRAALQRDGLETVFFRRDPADPDNALRIVGDFGATDGRWVEVLSGVRAGDEVVLDGGYQLMLATSGTSNKGGHFHADGTFHEGED
jgi:multidrug resistance efflux pump